MNEERKPVAHPRLSVWDRQKDPACWLVRALSIIVLGIGLWSHAELVAAFGLLGACTCWLWVPPSSGKLQGMQEVVDWEVDWEIGLFAAPWTAWKVFQTAIAVAIVTLVGLILWSKNITWGMIALQFVLLQGLVERLAAKQKAWKSIALQVAALAVVAIATWMLFTQT